MKAHLWDANSNESVDIPPEFLVGMTKASWQIFVVQQVINKIGVDRKVTRCMISDMFNTTTYMFQTDWRDVCSLMVNWDG